MEINQGPKQVVDQMAYQRAKKKAREIRDFYINLSLFCFFIPVIIGINLYFVPQFHWFWFSILGWGTGVTIHGITVFGFAPLFINNWEERKMQQFMNEETQKELLINKFKKQ